MIAVVEVTPDFKPAPRIVDKKALSRAMRENESNDHRGLCWGCPKPRRLATEPHHVIFKSQGGDDLVENIAPLCLTCHALLHRSVSGEAEEIAANIGSYMTDAMLLYVLCKKGVEPGKEYLERKYGRRRIPKRVTNQAYALTGTQRRTWRSYPGAQFR